MITYATPCSLAYMKWLLEEIKLAHSLMKHDKEGQLSFDWLENPEPIHMQEQCNAVTEMLCAISGKAIAHCTHPYILKALKDCASSTVSDIFIRAHLMGHYFIAKTEVTLDKEDKQYAFEELCATFFACSLVHRFFGDQHLYVVGASVLVDCLQCVLTNYDSISDEHNETFFRIMTMYLAAEAKHAQ